MILILCVDDAMGTSFEGKRQSRDRVVTKDILMTASDSVLWTDDYSARLLLEDPGIFSEDTVSPQNVRIDDACLTRADPGQYCFVEVQDTGGLTNLEEIILYRWNRMYPSTAKFAMPDGYTLIAEEYFPGYSHEKITREVYVK